MRNFSVRKREHYIVITFDTTHQAMAMEAYCMQKQISGRLIPVPREITAGCGLAWRMKPEEFLFFREMLAESGLEFAQVTELML